MFCLPAPCHGHPPRESFGPLGKGSSKGVPRTFGKRIFSFPESMFTCPRACLAFPPQRDPFGKVMFCLPGAMFCFLEAMFSLPGAIFTFPKGYLAFPKACLAFPPHATGIPLGKGSSSKGVLRTKESLPKECLAVWDLREGHVLYLHKPEFSG